MTEPSSLARQRRLPRLWHLTWPAILEQLLGMTVSFADTAMVGSLGASATAGVSVVASSIWLINGIMAGVGVGYSVQVANAVGAEDHALARKVIGDDDVVDQLFVVTKTRLIDFIAKDSTQGEYYLDLLMIAKYLERIADHATNIAEWVLFSITGRHET